MPNIDKNDFNNRDHLWMKSLKDNRGMRTLWKKIVDCIVKFYTTNTNLLGK